MIEVASYPPGLAGFRSTPETPCYLEVFGETSPQIDPSGALVLSSAADSGGSKDAAPVYEYWWTIGHGGDYDPRHKQWIDGDYSPNDADDPWNQLEDGVAARVYMFFPTWCGWRIKELAAQVKYLSPVRQSHSLLTAVAQDWKQVSPLVADAAQVAGLASGIPGAAAGAKEASNVLDTLAKLQINSVPPSGEYAWAAMKVTWVNDDGALQGVGWELPLKMFQDLGGRLTGSVALRFIQVGQQRDRDYEEEQQVPPLRTGTLKAQAHFLMKDRSTRKVPGNDHVPLKITPLAAKSTAANAAATGAAAAGRELRGSPDLSPR